MDSKTKNCQNCKVNFVIESDDFAFYKKIKVPPPTWCSRCRAIRRLSFRNLKHLYKRKCDVPGHSETFFTMTGPHTPLKIYDKDFWFSDQWDPLEYGKDYDFSRSFFEQLKELFFEVPMYHKHNLSNYGGDEYTSGGWQKNCYLTFNAGYNENCAYATTIQHAKWCFDMDNVEKSELSYYCFNIRDCYKTFFLQIVIPRQTFGFPKIW